MAKIAALALVCLLLAGCGSEDQLSARQSSPPSTRPPSSVSTSMSPSPSNVRLEQAIAICTDGIAEPDTLVGDAIDAARAGTRSVSEIATAFREAQDAVEELATEAETADFPDVAQSLQAYADVLGRARVGGDAGLTEMADAREAINAACLTAAVEQ
jgi:hypothetical protein